MSWQNVLAGDGVGLALTGMFIVFTGLLLMSFFIASLPRMLDWAGVARTRLASARIQAADESKLEREAMVWAEEDLLAAIGCVIQMELEYEQSRDDQRITIRRGEAEHNWEIIGKMRTLSTRM